MTEVIKEQYKQEFSKNCQKWWGAKIYILMLSKNINNNKNDAGNVTPANGDGKEVNSHKKYEYESNTEALKTVRNGWGIYVYSNIVQER